MLRNVPLMTLIKDLHMIHLLLEIPVAVVTETVATLGQAILPGNGENKDTNTQVQPDGNNDLNTGEPTTTP
jgi:hypothetical protein